MERYGRVARVFKDDKGIISMEKPLVSVLTITRNRGNLLRRCISSVLSQTYTNIEHVIVDGASDDNTDEVVDSFKDDRLKFHKLDYNWPLKKTSDYGISLCKGKYITFLDSDDEYLPSKIEKQVDLIESLREDYGLVYCWMTYFDNNTHEVLKYHKPELRGYVADKTVGGPVLSGTPTLLFRSEVIRDLDGWKSQDEIGIISDWELCARATQKYKVDYVPESLVNVYINHGVVRQSESAYYKGYYEKYIKFHHYFLNQFSHHFDKNPKLAFNHYWYLFMFNFKIREYRSALFNLFKASRCDFKKTIRNLFSARKND